MDASAPDTVALTDPANGVGLWLCRLDRDAAAVAALVELLSPVERARADRFGTTFLRNRWIVGRATLRSLLGNALDLDPAAVCLARGIRGRPELEGDHRIDFNVSHTGGTALIALALRTLDAKHDGMRIGVDLEREDRKVNADGLARKFLTVRERAEIAPMAADDRRRRFLRLWTCKEAMSKATGDALSAPFRQLDVALEGRPRLVGGPAPYAPGAWRLVAADVPSGLIATLAIWHPQRGPDSA